MSVIFRRARLVVTARPGRLVVEKPSPGPDDVAELDRADVAELVAALHSWLDASRPRRRAIARRTPLRRSH